MGAIIRIMLTVLSGVGIGEILDKFFADKLPFRASTINKEGGFVKNLAILVGLSVAGTMLVRWLLKTFKLQRKIKL